MSGLIVDDLLGRAGQESVHCIITILDRRLEIGRVLIIQLSLNFEYVFYFARINFDLDYDINLTVNFDLSFSNYLHDELVFNYLLNLVLGNKNWKLNISSI